MARSAKRKKTVGTAPSMAAMRDAATVRSINFQAVNELLNTEGPGNPNKDPIVHQIDVTAGEPILLGDFMGMLLDTIYLDLICPGYGTAQKLHKWVGICKEIAVENAQRLNVKSTFNGLSRQIKICAKRMEDLIHYEASDEDLKYALYDLVLKISMDHSIKIKGLLPPV